MVKRGYEPELKPVGADIAGYDVIAVGTPTWWYTMAPAVRTFLHQNDLRGKTVVPFMTNGGWPGHVIKDMKALCPGADWEEQAALKAASYLSYSAFSKKELIEQLEYEGFTHEQAVHGVNAVYD